MRRPGRGRNHCSTEVLSKCAGGIEEHAVVVQGTDELEMCAGYLIRPLVGAEAFPPPQRRARSIVAPQISSSAMPQANMDLPCPRRLMLRVDKR
jgi:hypothetical protein